MGHRQLSTRSGIPRDRMVPVEREVRDDVRSFVRGEPGKVGALMRRL